MIGLVSRSKSSPNGESRSVTTKPKAKPAGRERLRQIDGEIAKANQAAVEIEEKIERLQAIISEAEAHHNNLQLAIMVDGGKALREFSDGQATDDSPIAKLVTSANNSAQAKPAAEAALPKAQADLQNVREQAIKLNEARNAELNRVIANLADVEAQAYQKAFNELARLHDRLCGYAEVMESNIGDIRRIIEPLKTVRFTLPSLASSIDADPFIRHNVPSELTVNEAARYWRSVREKLAADSDAEI